MTFWQRILQGMAALLTGTSISMIAGLASAFLTFRYLSPDEYGRLMLFISYYSTGAIFLTLGLDAVVTSEVARARGEKSWERIRKILRIYTSLVVGAGALLFALFAGIGAVSNHSLLWFIMGLYLFLTGPSRIMSILFHSTTRYRRLASLTIIRAVMRLLLLLFLPIWWSGETLFGIAIIYPLLEIMVLGTAIWLFRHTWREIAQPDLNPAPFTLRDFWALMQKQGVYVIVGIPITTVADQFPIWFLRVLIGETAVGLYSAAKRTFVSIYTMFRTIETILFPLISEQMTQNPERLKVALRQAQKYTFWLSLLAGIIIMFVADQLIILIAGSEYIQASIILKIIIWQLLFAAISQTQRPVFFANRSQKWLFLTNLGAFFVGLILYPIAIIQFGVAGAGLGFLLVSGATIIARQQLIRIHISDFYTPPQSIFQIESFDKLLLQNISQRLFRQSKP